MSELSGYDAWKTRLPDDDCLACDRCGAWMTRERGQWICERCDEEIRSLEEMREQQPMSDERHEYERAQLNAEITSLRQRAEAAEKRVAELEAALRPFAEADGAFMPAFPPPVWRAAAAALAKGGVE